jgi:putative transposase
LAEISITENPLEGVLSADQIDAMVTTAQELGGGRNGVEELLGLLRSFRTADLRSSSF